MLSFISSLRFFSTTFLVFFLSEMPFNRSEENPSSLVGFFFRIEEREERERESRKEDEKKLGKSILENQII